ncbi:MAG: lamin tail domain-containing protein [Polyangiaceae bacterium]
MINEISAAGDDFVELYNAGAAPFDLTGYGLCDTADDGTPKVAEATRFVDGETLAPGAFLVVVADLAAAPPGPQTDCLAGAVATCYHASWGISAGKGEKIFLLDTTDAQVGVAEYGPDAVPEGQTLGHIPDGEGALVPNAPTPGAANAAP